MNKRNESLVITAQTDGCKNTSITVMDRSEIVHVSGGVIESPGGSYRKAK